LMVMQHINFFRNLETVVRELDSRGHETVILHGTRLDDPEARAKLSRKRQKMVFMGRGLAHAETVIPSMTSGYRPLPPERWQNRLRIGRQVMNISIYLRNGHPSPDRSRVLLEKRLPAQGRKWIGSRVGRAAIRTRLALGIWRRIERIGRPSETVTGLLEEIRPDVVLVSPMVWPKDPVEADYVYAARERGIPTIGYLNSWDNLTSKGTVHVLPDVFVVWNEALAEEARELHDIPSELIRVTGAPHLEHMFEMGPSAPRAELCERMGCPDDRAYVVYLCTSRTLIQDETHIVDALADALSREIPDRPPTVVVRPHPVNSAAWEGYDKPGVVVHPGHGDQADTVEAWQEYFDQLWGAAAVIGLNTTAFLEAAVADRPCLTILGDDFVDVQARTGHFRHLLDGDFLETSSDVAGAASRVARVLDGEDEKAEGRRRFVQAFLRPRGIDVPASSVVVDTIEGLANPVAAPARAPGSSDQLAPSAVTAGDDA
jgi:hypothetical protein